MSMWVSPLPNTQQLDANRNRVLREDTCKGRCLCSGKRSKTSEENTKKGQGNWFAVALFEHRHHISSELLTSTTQSIEFAS